MSQRNLFFFVHVEDTLDKKATSGPIAFSLPTPYKRLALLVEQIFAQQQREDEGWYLIYYTGYAEERREVVQNWLHKQRIWSENPRTMLLMKDPLMNQTHVNWTIGMVHQVSAMLESSNKALDYCHVFDSSCRDLQQISDRNSGQYPDIVAYRDMGDLQEDLSYVLSEKQLVKG